MENATHFSFLSLTLVLVLIGLALAYASLLVSGGFKIGRLKLQLELKVGHDQFPSFLARMNHRLVELGFQAASPSGPYRQGAYTVGSAVVPTHANTTKVLEFSADQSHPQAVKVVLLVRFEETIFGDSGETAYADAVLKYITNESDAMRLVPNTHLMAVFSLVFAVWEWVAMAGLVFFRIEPFVHSLMTLTACSTGVGLVAIVSIMLKPAELRGVWLAFLGIVISLAAFGTSVLLAHFARAA